MITDQDCQVNPRLLDWVKMTLSVAIGRVFIDSLHLARRLCTLTLIGEGEAFVAIDASEHHALVLRFNFSARGCSLCMTSRTY